MKSHEIIRLAAQSTDWQQVLDLIQTSFSHMNGTVDPPSSALKLTPDMLHQRAEKEYVFGIMESNEVIACLFCDVRPDYVYVGKLAIAPEHQNKGYGKLLMARAEALAHKLHLAEIELQVRIELQENRAFFEQLGYTKIGETSHEGYDRPTSLTFRKWLE